LARNSTAFLPQASAPYRVVMMISFLAGSTDVLSLDHTLYSSPFSFLAVRCWSCSAGIDRVIHRHWLAQRTFFAIREAQRASYASLLLMPDFFPPPHLSNFLRARHELCLDEFLVLFFVTGPIRFAIKYFFLLSFAISPRLSTFLNHDFFFQYPVFQMDRQGCCQYIVYELLGRVSIHRTMVGGFGNA